MEEIWFNLRLFFLLFKFSEKSVMPGVTVVEWKLAQYIWVEDSVSFDVYIFLSDIEYWYSI